MKLSIAPTLLALLIVALGPSAGVSAEPDSTGVDIAAIAAAGKLIGLSFTDQERDSARSDLTDNLESYRSMRAVGLNNSVAPSLLFNPVPAGVRFDMIQKPLQMGPAPTVVRPENLNDLAFYTVRQLSELVRTGQVTSTELTNLALGRLRDHDPQLHCVITLTEETALAQAARADEEIAQGLYRGPLHGIPFGAKDLLAAKGYPTTWGAAPYQDQVIDQNATVINKLEEAGAILVAKLSLGALAWGDVWFGDTTRNPWNLEQGSSGSSAGSASAVAAGLVPFAIGSETWGSIVSPSTRCGATGLRPTFGRVSRAGAMALSWSMDKLGPIARTVEDCVLVLDAIRGPDDQDLTVLDLPFNYDASIDLASLRIGYLKSDFDLDSGYMAQNRQALQTLRDMGANLIEMALPDLPVYPLAITLSAEAAAAFDDLTLSNRDDLLVRQIKNAWPNVFRSSRFIPAVEYLQANRHRTLLINAMAEVMTDIDLYVAPSFEGSNLLLTNLTGHPCVVVPNGFDDEGSPVSITFVGNLFDEGTAASVAWQFQQKAGFHLQHPPLFAD